MNISTTSAQYIKGVGPDRLKLLKRLGISTVQDCLLHFPRRYEDRSNLKPISELKEDEYQTVKGKVLSSSVFSTRRGRRIFQLAVGDDSGKKLYCLWFNQPYMKRYFTEGDTIIVYGKAQKTSRFQIIHPEYEIIREDSPTEDPIHTGRIVPIYPLVSGVNQRTLRAIMKHGVQQYSRYVQELMPTNIRARHHLIDIHSAIKNIHFPINDRQASEARRRIVFDEFFIHQLALAIRRYKMKLAPEGRAHKIEAESEDEFFKALSFELTNAQKKTIEEIRNDMASQRAMHRLIQGEVGSGKTVISAYGLFLTVSNNHQGAIMVPTEILAKQHYITLSNIFSEIGIRVVLLINSMPKPEKDQAKELTESGEADIIVGTHTLIQSGIAFKDLGLVVIDEQHKFGVQQRALLKTKTQNPDIMVMTATPIPRTMAMTLYGDMDISVVDELPQGKRDVQTLWLDSSEVDKDYAVVKIELKEKRQAYIIYPVIDESQALRSEGAVKMYNKLKDEIFKEFEVGLIHGRLSDEEKTTIMKDFKKGKIDVLVATTIVEVGIDVTNASIMVIENAQRFGLSQLHQLRGRIGRGKQRSYCILVSDAQTEEAQQRLEAISKMDDGFDIAQEDLNIRGPGELFGKRQHGLPELTLGNVISDVEILEEARKEAFELISDDPSLSQDRYKALKEKLTETFKEKFHLGFVG
ncbi:MAG: ATP-dependent DNA helicase RecG [Candidatus Omnitrophica bacterium]|nr:ATP-dependent DNA helicase RecG [Candidatus Omnitrophota bacterium]